MAYVDFPINSHLDRLKYDEYREKPSLFGDYWLASFLGICGAVSVPLGNSFLHRPIYTGIWRAAIAIPVGAALGFYLRDKFCENSRLKWAKIRHYIELHPEDFPPYPPRTKVGDTLAPWIPVRTGW